MATEYRIKGTSIILVDRGPSIVGGRYYRRKDSEGSMCLLDDEVEELSRKRQESDYPVGTSLRFESSVDKGWFYHVGSDPEGWLYVGDGKRPMRSLRDGTGTHTWLYLLGNPHIIWPDDK